MFNVPPNARLPGFRVGLPEDRGADGDLYPALSALLPATARDPESELQRSERPGQPSTLAALRQPPLPNPLRIDPRPWTYTPTPLLPPPSSLPWYLRVPPPSYLMPEPLYFDFDRSGPTAPTRRPWPPRLWGPEE